MLKFLFPILILISGILEKAPDFQFENVNGEEQTLSDYEGEVVYIAFWASWCRPCLTNFKKYKEMRKTLEEKGVVLLNVSLDKKKRDWKLAIKHNDDLIGENVHVTDLNKVMELYQLSMIPEYRILNKKMEIVSLGQQGGRDVVKSFEQLLKE